VPLAPPVTVNHAALDDELHAQPVCVVTERLPVAAAADTDALLGESVKVQAAQTLPVPQDCPLPQVPHETVCPQ
jgi:hypothetical protein